MYAKLSGIVDFTDEDHVVLDVGGVGYLVFTPKKLLDRLYKEQNIILFIHTVVKEDEITLYGFIDYEEKKMFKLLNTVQGVGGKMALSILSDYSTMELCEAIIAKQQHIFKSISGVGNKIAQRIINELQDKVSDMFSLQKSSYALGTLNDQSTMGEAVGALRSLGYSSVEINSVLKDVMDNNKGELLEVEMIVKEALQIFSQRIK